MPPAIPTLESLDLLSPRSREVALKDWTQLLAERGTERERGDLVLIDGAPDKDIRQISRVSIVFHDGVAYDPKALIERAKGKVGK